MLLVDVSFDVWRYFRVLFFALIFIWWLVGFLLFFVFTE